MLIMRNRGFILSFLILMMTVNFVFAQVTSKKLSYQAVVRNAANELVINQTLTVEITIFDANDQPQYKETHTVTTNQNGLLWLWIGDGTPVQGTIDDVVWKDATIESSFTLPDGNTVTQNTPVTAIPYAYYADDVNPLVIQDYLDDHNYINDDNNFVKNPQLDDTLSHYYTDEEIDDTLGHYVTTDKLNDTLDNYITTDKLNDTLGNYVTTDKLNDTLNDYLKKDELCDQVLECVEDTLSHYTTTNHIDTLLGNYVTKDTLSYYTTTNKIDTLLGAYYDTTQVKSAIHDTANVLRSMMGGAANNATITIQKNGTEVDHFTVNQVDDQTINIEVPTTVAELTDASNYVTNATLHDTLDYYTTTNKIDTLLGDYATKDTLSYYTTSNKVDTLLGNYATKDTLSYYTTTNKIDTLLGDYATKDTLSYYTTSDNIDTLLGAYFDTTQVKSAIHDTANVLRSMMGTAANNAKITIQKNGEEVDHFTVNQVDDQTINIAVPTTVAELQDASNFVTNASLHDTLNYYTTTNKIDTLLGDYATKDTLSYYTTSNKVDTLLGNYATKDTLSYYTTTNKIDTLLGDYATKDTLSYYTTSDNIDTLLGAYFDTTQVKSAIHDTANVLRSMMGTAANNAKITIQKNGEEVDHFTVNQVDDQTINIAVPTTVAELQDASNFVTNASLHDTLNYYTTTNKIDTLLGDYATKDTLSYYTTSGKIDTLLGDYATKDTLSYYTTTDYIDSIVEKHHYLTSDSTVITAMQGNIQTNSTQIAANTAAINALQDKLNSDSTDLVNKIYADSSTLATRLDTIFKHLCDTIEQNCTNIALKDKNNIFSGNNTFNGTSTFNKEVDFNEEVTFDSTTYFNNIARFDSTVYFDGNTYFSKEVDVDADVLFKKYNYYFSVNNFFEHDAIVLINDVLNHNNLSPVASTADDSLNRLQAVNYNDLRFVFDSLSNKIDINNTNACETVSDCVHQWIGDSTRMVFDTLHLYYATKDTLKNFVNKLAIRDSVNNIVKDSLAAPNSAINQAIDTIARHNISDSTRMVFDTLHLYYATKKALKDTASAIRGDICDSATACITKALADANSEINHAIDTIARHNISDSTRMVFDTLHLYYATKKALKDTASAIRGDICDSATTCITKALADANSAINHAIDTIARYNIHDTAIAIRAAIHDSLSDYKIKDCGDVTTCVNTALADGTSATNHAIDSIAGNVIHDSIKTNIQANIDKTIHDSIKTNIQTNINKTIHDSIVNNISSQIHDSIGNGTLTIAITGGTSTTFTANSKTPQSVNLAKVAGTGSYNDLSDKPSIPTIPTDVSAFTNDTKYVNNASCDSLDFCALMAKVNALATSMGDFNNTINDMQHTIDSLEGVIDALSSLLPKVTLTTDKTTAPIGSGDVASVICTATLKNANGYTLYWKVDDIDSTSNHNTPFTVNFTTVGTHKIVCTAKQEGFPDLKDSVTITITKGTPTVNVTMPTDLVYTGAPQALVTSGSTTGGELQYKLNDGTYSTSIPEATAVGNYTVSYRVVGNDNWNDVDETSVDVTISKMPITLSVSITGWTSGETANTPSVTGNTSNGAVTYTYKVKDADDNTYNAAVPTCPGEYTVRATVAETDNYSAGEATADFTITPGSDCDEPSGTPATIIEVPTATPGTITAGTTTPLVTAGVAENGTMMYAVTTNTPPTISDFSTTVPTAANLTAGTCYVWYYAQGIDPYTDSPIAGPIEVTVNPPAFSVSSTKRVYFSSSNLQASTTDYGNHWTWHFAANPWNYNGDGTVNTNDKYYHNERINGNGVVKFSGAGTVDQFGWVGTSNTTWEGELGTTLNAAMYGISNSWNNSDYGNVSGESLKSDWGNTINDGYNWRTLTSAEWSYLLASRASGSTVPGKIKNSDLSYTNITVNNARYTLARINIDATPVNGMIIFPDGITIEESEITQRGYINREIGNTMYDTWEDGTKCTTEQWTALAAKGCVFLPMGGAYRYVSGSNTPVYQPGTSAGYWSSSPVNATQAYFVSISKSYVDPRSSDNLISNDDRKRGHMVRLVRDAE